MQFFPGPYTDNFNSFSIFFGAIIYNIHIISYVTRVEFSYYSLRERSGEKSKHIKE
jgi:hypothetical protein